jgi:glycosyltransferase involved in cell wall biosynthesis
VARRADLVTTVTEPITRDLAERVSTPVMTLTNGFDPDERVRASKEDAGLEPDRFSLVYTGRLAFARSTPRPFLDAVRALRFRAPDAAGRLEAVFAGPLSDGERALLAAPDLDGLVRWAGNLRRAEALALQAAADGLLLVVPASRSRSVATAKLYEYLATGRPILVLGEENAAAGTVREAGAGIVTAADDPERIAADLERLVTGGESRGASNGAVERYAYPNLAARLAERLADIAPAT